MLAFSQSRAEIFIPSGESIESAFTRSTALGIGAHQDDLEIMALEGILKGYVNANEGFVGVTVTNGASSARSGPYKDYSDTNMMEVRREEQREAAKIGKYTAMVQLDHPSAHVKDSVNTAVVDDLEKILLQVKPREVYTHNLADKHDTHVGVVLKLVQAIRRLPLKERPKRLVGCEVWRDLDWLRDEDKVVMNVDGHDDLADRLMAVFDSQIGGGKRYDIAVRARRKAHATFSESHAVDYAENVIFGMDLTPLVLDDKLEPKTLFERHLIAFRDEVKNRLKRLR